MQLSTTPRKVAAVVAAAAALVAVAAGVPVAVVPKGAAAVLTNTPCAVVQAGLFEGGTCTGAFVPNALPTPVPTPTPLPTPTATPGPTDTPIVTPPPTPTATPIAGCTGSPLTAQNQVHANTSYCGGHATSRIVLANGDSWTNGEVSGASSGQQQGAVQCGSPCTLVNMNIHDNLNAFAGVYMPGSGPGPNLVSGGRITNNGSLGIGGSGVNGLTVTGVEIDHNGSRGSCGFEAGGFKGVNVGSVFTHNNVHDNSCAGVWYDINSANTTIAFNTVTNNADEGIFYEISQDASIHDNVVSGNGFQTNGPGNCVWQWGGGIGIASSFNVVVFNNTLVGNCNGIVESQQNRTDSTPPAHLLQNVSVTNNSISGPGVVDRTGASADNGANLATRGLTFSGNTFTNGATFCGISC